MPAACECACVGIGSRVCPRLTRSCRMHSVLKTDTPANIPAARGGSTSIRQNSADLTMSGHGTSRGRLAINTSPLSGSQIAEKHAAALGAKPPHPARQQSTILAMPFFSLGSTHSNTEVKNRYGNGRATPMGISSPSWTISPSTTGSVCFLAAPDGTSKRALLVTALSSQRCSLSPCA